MAPMMEQIAEQEAAIREYDDSRKPVDSERRKVRSEFDALRKQAQDLNVSIRSDPAET